MDGKEAAGMVRKELAYLHNIIKDFTPEHGDFSPTPGMMTTSQQINHIAHTVKWFRNGAFGAGFDMDFEKLEAANHRPVAFMDAMTELEMQYDGFVRFLEQQSQEELNAPMADNPIFGTAPRYIVLLAQADHTAHHRGVLSVYLRLLGMVPKMIYM